MMILSQPLNYCLIRWFAVSSRLTHYMSFGKFCSIWFQKKFLKNFNFIKFNKYCFKLNNRKIKSLILKNEITEESANLFRELLANQNFFLPTLDELNSDDLVLLTRQKNSKFKNFKNLIFKVN